MEPITIRRDAKDCWIVDQGEKSSDELNWGEMMDTLACLTMPAERRALQWMRTAEQRETQERQWRERIAQRDKAAAEAVNREVPKGTL